MLNLSVLFHHSPGADSRPSHVISNCGMQRPENMVKRIQKGEYPLPQMVRLVVLGPAILGCFISRTPPNSSLADLVNVFVMRVMLAELLKV